MCSKFNNKRCAILIVLCSAGWMHIKKNRFSESLLLISVVFFFLRALVGPNDAEVTSAWSFGETLKLCFSGCLIAIITSDPSTLDRCAVAASVVICSSSVILPVQFHFSVSDVTLGLSGGFFSVLPAPFGLRLTLWPNNTQPVSGSYTLKTVLYRVGSML